MLRITSTKAADGWQEIGFRKEDNSVFAVITHTNKTAGWFVHPEGFKPHRKFATKAKALECVSSLADKAGHWIDYGFGRSIQPL
jgi:hypothetical protein